VIKFIGIDSSTDTKSGFQIGHALMWVGDGSKPGVLFRCKTERAVSEKDADEMVSSGKFKAFSDLLELDENKIQNIPRRELYLAQITRESLEAYGEDFLLRSALKEMELEVTAIHSWLDTFGWKTILLRGVKKGSVDIQPYDRTPKDMKMRLVKQKKVGQCGPACLAMVTGMTLEEVMEEVGDVSYGLNDAQMVDFLMKHNIPAISSTIWPSAAIPAILTVPSLNHIGLLHYVVWDGERFLDPTMGQKEYPGDAHVLENGREIIAWATAILIWPYPVVDFPK